MPERQFWAGVAASLTAAFIAWVVVQLKSRALLSWGTLSLFWSVTRRLKDTGVSNFFTSRSDYALFRKQKTISDYISTARKELVYVGFWLAKAVEIENIQDKLRELLDRGCTVELVFLDRNLDPTLRSKIAACLGMSQDSLVGRLDCTWSDMRSFRDDLPEEVKPRFILRSHQEFISSSALIFDPATEHAKTLVDFKLYGAGRQNSFGIELKPSKLPNSLYERVTDSFLEVRRESSTDA